MHDWATNWDIIILHLYCHAEIQDGGPERHEKRACMNKRDARKTYKHTYIRIVQECYIIPRASSVCRYYHNSH